MKKLEERVSMLCQDWREFERGWGDRYGGTTAFVSQEVHGRYMADEERKRMAAMVVPDEYDLPDGEPYWRELPRRFYEAAQKHGGITAVGVPRHREVE